ATGPRSALCSGSTPRRRKTEGKRMVTGLTVSERHMALFVLGALALAGLAMAVGGRGDPLAVHGYIVLAFSLGLGFVVLSALFAPEPPESRLSEYYDDPTRVGIILSLA